MQNSPFRKKKRVFIVMYLSNHFISLQKQPPRGVPRISCSKNMQQIYRRTPMPKCVLKKLRHGCSPVNLLHVFRTAFPRNTSGRLLLSLGKISNQNTANCHFRTKKILKNSKRFAVPCLQPMDLKVSGKLSQKKVSCHFICILFMKGAHLCICFGRQFLLNT